MDHRTCDLTGCDKPVKPRHLKCSMHLARIARHGDPDTVVAYEERAFQRGSDSPNWNPEGSYSAVHQRLRKVRGSATDHTCSCRAPARQWSYDRTDPNEKRAPEGPFSTDLNRYRPLCVPCHKVFDLTALGKR